jgi:hypothetical protein
MCRLDQPWIKPSASSVWLTLSNRSGIVYDALVSIFRVRALSATAVEPAESETEVKYGGNSINDTNPSGNPD